MKAISIDMADYDYPLPDERIAKYPLPERDSSKLLHYKEGQIVTHVFRELPELLPSGTLMIRNETKVVPARLFFRRESGALIEVMCLEPLLPCEYNLSFAATDSCEWKCVVGNAKKWKGDTIYFCNVSQSAEIEAIGLKADLVERDGASARVRFSWNGGRAFSEVLDLCGKVPIPPYLGRDTEQIDSTRYQTTYARIRGSVAAPTAGLHFTPAVSNALIEKGVRIENVCLHVGAGTFLPVKDGDVARHNMHREPFGVSLSLLESLSQSGVQVTAVGTTSVRTLESLYYAGVDCIEKGQPCEIEQWAPYSKDYRYSTEEALKALCDYLRSSGKSVLELGTRIIIVPGFKFRLVDRMVTNFHQPKSTLLLLISAFVGEENWRSIYSYALENGYRFLSYGDSSLLERG